MEPSSPFDEALARPLLEEPVKKRWSNWWSLSSNARQTICHGGSSPSNDSSLLSVDYRDTFAPTMEIQSEAAAHEEPRQTCLLLEMEEGGQYLDIAVFRERYEGIRNVHTAMTHIHAIQKGRFALDIETMDEFLPTRTHVRSSQCDGISLSTDLATVVEWQSETVDALEQKADEATYQATAGVAHLQALHRYAVERNRRRRERWVALSGLLVAVVGVHWVVHEVFQRDGDDYNGGAPKSSWP
jgi:hypothetical protein